MTEDASRAEKRFHPTIDTLFGEALSGLTTTKHNHFSALTVSLA